MKLEFFDVNIFLGMPAQGVFRPVSTASELLKELDALGIKRALVWHIAQYDYSPVEGNRLLSQAIEGKDRLLGCWTVLPPQTKEVINEDFFARMKQNRIFGLRAFPDIHRFLLNKVVFGNFLEEMSERRIPLLLSFDDDMAKSISWTAVYQLMEEFPNLTCVLCDLGIWGVDRYTWPLLEKYSNLYLETSLLSLEDGEIEATVKRFGVSRLVFGSGFPRRYPQAAILQLLHCQISDSDKKKIASTNMEQLISKIKL